MFIHVTTTQNNVKVFPLHKHETWEYICYEEGEGVLKTEAGDMPFKVGTVVVVPPLLKHGSSSENDFKNICVHTDLRLTDNHKLYVYSASKALRELFAVIKTLSREKDRYLPVIEILMPALKELILKEASLSAESSVLSHVHGEITKNFADSEFDLGNLIKQSGYVEDVFRVKFKKAYGVTPKAYLDGLKMSLAKDYLRVYGKILSIKEVSEMCGFKDSLYFSRKFRQKFGVYPKEYVKTGGEDRG